MAHFAQIDSNNIVKQVLVVSDSDAVSGHAFLADVLGLGGTWIQTSYNTYGNTHHHPLSAGVPDGGRALRGNYAGVGHIYDPINDVFYPPQPYASWTISSSSNWKWVPPFPCPTDGKYYTWDESIKNWVVSSF